MAVAVPDSKSHAPTPRVASRGRRVFHTLIALAGWALFVYWWWIVVHRVSLHEVRFTVLFVLVALVLCVAITGLWVLHNLSIFRRRGQRTKVREATLDYSRDPLGRTAEASVQQPLQRGRLGGSLVHAASHRRDAGRSALQQDERLCGARRSGRDVLLRAVRQFPFSQLRRAWPKCSVRFPNPKNVFRVRMKIG